jgi:hypothetical protein
MPQGQSNHVVFRNEAAKRSKPPTVVRAVFVVLLADEGAIEAFNVGTSEKIRLAYDTRVHSNRVDCNIHLGVVCI